MEILILSTLKRCFNILSPQQPIKLLSTRSSTLGAGTRLSQARGGCSSYVNVNLEEELKVPCRASSCKVWAAG